MQEALATGMKDEAQESGDPAQLYHRLMDGAAGSGGDPFDAHVVASMIAIAASEAEAQGLSLSDTLGINAATLAVLIGQFFPATSCTGALPRQDETMERSSDEACLLDLLKQGTTAHTAFQYHLAEMIARRAQCSNHLWQDLGLRDRRDLSQLMTRHFKPLSRRNNQDMKWKKFLYRMICADTGYALCTAPSCGECDDFDVCFGEETGESLLARTRRNAVTNI